MLYHIRFRSLERFLSYVRYSRKYVLPIWKIYEGVSDYRVFSSSIFTLDHLPSVNVPSRPIVWSLREMDGLLS